MHIQFWIHRFGNDGGMLTPNGTHLALQLLHRLCYLGFGILQFVRLVHNNSRPLNAEKKILIVT